MFLLQAVESGQQVLVQRRSECRGLIVDDDRPVAVARRHGREFAKVFRLVIGFVAARARFGSYPTAEWSW
jgi:hypothetical protein